MATSCNQKYSYLFACLHLLGIARCKRNDDRDGKSSLEEKERKMKKLAAKIDIFSGIATLIYFVVFFIIYWAIYTSNVV